MILNTFSLQSIGSNYSMYSFRFDSSFFDMKEFFLRSHKLYFSIKWFNTVVQIDDFSTKFQ